MAKDTTTGGDEAYMAPANPAPADEGPKTLVAPATAEDPSRGMAPVEPAKGMTFPGFPKTKYHPVYGAREVKDPNEEATLQPAHNWFDTPEMADARRTLREADLAASYNRRVKVDGALNGAVPTTEEDDAVMGRAGVVRNSNQATEALKNGVAEPL